MTTAPATRCPHRRVFALWEIGQPFPYFTCDDCDQRVRPAAWVLESQPLPDELALMDFAARAARRERDA